MIKFSWDQRIGRAEQLAATHAFAAELLRFYREIACFQKDFYGYLESTNGVPTNGNSDANQLDSLDAASLFPRFASLLALVQRVGHSLPGPSCNPMRNTSPAKPILPRPGMGIRSARSANTSPRLEFCERRATVPGAP